MSDVKQLIIGIVLVGIGLFTVLSGAGGFVPFIGGALGLVGCALTVKVILTGNLK